MINNKLYSYDDKIDLFYVETSYHLFLALLKTKHNKNKSIILLDAHRKITQLSLVYLKKILEKYRIEFRISHNYPQFNNINMSNFLAFLTYNRKLSNEVNDIIRVIPIRKVNTLYIFTTNRIERHLINRFKKNKDLKVVILEEGIGTYTHLNHIISDVNNPIFKFIRKVLGLEISISSINQILYLNPSLVDNSISNSFRIEELSFDQKIVENFAMEIRDAFDFDIIPRREIIFMLSSPTLKEFELNFIIKNITQLNAYVKTHPSDSVITDLKNLAYINWELYHMAYPPKLLISCCSSSGIGLLKIFPQIRTKFIFLFLVYKELGLEVFNYTSETSFFLNLEKLYTDKVYIPKNLSEFLKIINEISMNL